MGILKTESTYPFKHWMTSVAIVPLVQIFFLQTDSTLAGFAEMYFLYIVFGIAFSLPTFILYLFLFNRLVRKNYPPIMMKIILNSITILGIFITVKIIGGTLMTETLAWHYSIGTIISSFLYKIDLKTADV